MAAFSAAIVAFSQWQFRLDTTFRTDLLERTVHSMALQDDGIILSGTMRFPGDMSDRLLAKVDFNGAQITSFPFGYGGGKITPWNDKYYVSVGQSVRRIQLTGVVDPSFIGLNLGPYFSSISGGDYHVFEDGRLLITGNHILSDSIRGFQGPYQLIWFSNEGYLDTTRIHRQANGILRELTALPDGKFLCSCSCTQYEGQPVGRVFRIHADGSLDTTFNTDVWSGTVKEYHAYLDGRVLIAGNFRSASAPLDTFWIARFHPDGAMDPSFAPPHFGEEGAGWPAAGTAVFDILEFRPGIFLVTGQFTSVNGQPRAGICLIDDDGELLPDFNGCGVGPFTWNNVTNASVLNVYFGSDSSTLYICGTYNGFNDGTINDPQQRFVSRLLVVEVPVAIEEVPRSSPAFSIHPNPASGTVSFTFNHLEPDASLLIRDAIGRLIDRLPVRSSHISWPIGSLSSGIYLVEHVVGGVVRSMEKLVVE
jgi:hypothetical protein